MRLTLRLALHQPSLVEAWRGPEAWRADLREPVAGIRQGIVEAHASIGEVRPDAGLTATAFAICKGNSLPCRLPRDGWPAR